MNDPQPLEYELDHGDQKAPETEAEALARIQREDEERARQLGLVREKGAPVGKKWLDGIGGNSANATASRLLEQEARIAERKRQARAAALRLAIGGVLAVALLGAGAVVGLDYMGVVRLGLFKHDEPKADPATVAHASAAQVAQVAQRAPDPTPPTKPKPAIQVLGVLGESQPIDNPVSEPPPERDSRDAPAAAEPAQAASDPSEQKRLERRLAAAQRGVDAIQKDLDAKQAAIRQKIVALYGVVPEPRDSVLPRDRWVYPCAMIEAEQARAVPRTNANAAAWNLRVDNADAAIRNILAGLKHDREIEADVLGRLKKATKERDAAQAALAASP